MTERGISNTRCSPVDSFQRFTPKQRAAWIDLEREDERRRRAFVREAEARLSRRSKLGRKHERSILFELLGDPYIREPSQSRRARD
jgi:hypothetical protein